MGIRNSACPSAVLGSPLVRTGWALHELPLIAVQVLQVIVAPLHWSGGPCDLQPAADRVHAMAVAKVVFPAEALLLDGSALGFGADILARIGGAMSLAERVATGNQGNGFLIIHRHTGEGLPNVPCRREW